MAENITLNPVATFQNDTTAVNTVNNNNATITTAFQDVLSLSGQSPNKMNSPLDMNSFPIMNLPAPGSSNSPARLIDVTTTNPINISLSLSGDVTAPASSGVLTTTINKTPTNGNVLLANGSVWNSSPGGTIVGTNTGTSGHTIPFLDGNNTFSGNNVYSGNNTFTANPGVQTASGPSSVVINPQAASQQASVLMQQGGVSKWQLGKQTDNSFFIFDTAASANIATATTGSGLFIRGTNTNDNAATGFVGEYIPATVGTPGSSISTGTSANVTSISLTAGDWDVWGISYFIPAASTSITQLQSSVSTTSATLNTSPGNWATNAFAAQVPGGGVISSGSGPIRLSLASTTTVFLVVNATFTVSTMTAYGTIQARRVR